MIHEDLMRFESEFLSMLKLVNKEITHHFINESYKLRIQDYSMRVSTYDWANIYLVDRKKEEPFARLEISSNNNYTSHIDINTREMVEFKYAHKFCSLLYDVIGGTDEDAKIFLDELRIGLI